MNSFCYQYPVRQHFGKGCAENAIKEEMKKVGKRVMFAYGGSSLKRMGLYNKVCDWLMECGKEIDMPTRWSEMGITNAAVLRAAADTCFLTPGCCKQFSRDEIFEMLKEVM